MEVRQTLRRHFQQAKWRPFAVVIFLEILFALALLRSPGTDDVALHWMRWIEGISQYGLIDGYRLNAGDYPPGSSVILLFVLKMAATCSNDVFLSFKISLVVALLCSTLCYWGWTLDATLAGLLAFSLLLNGVALGYLDTYFAPTLILSLWALQRKKIALFSLLFSVSCLIKWQPLIIGPFLFLHALSLSKGSRNNWRAIGGVWLRLIAPSLGVILLAVATFGYQPIAASIHDALNHTLLSGNALNFNWLVTYLLRALHPEQYGAIVNGVVSYIHIDPSAGWVRAIKLIFVLFYLGALWRFFKMRTSFGGMIECSLAGYLSYFVFNIGVHENHLFLATVLAAVGAARARQTLGAILIVALSNLNLITFYGLTGAAFRATKIARRGIPSSFSPVVGIDVSLIFAAVNVLLFLFFWGDLVLRRRSISDEDHAPA